MAEITVCSDPVFVIGAPRSGLSVVASAIARHELFWTSGETDYLYKLFGQGRLNRMWLDCGGGTEHNWLARNGFGRERFAEALGIGFNAFLGERANGLRWVDPTPSHTTMLDELAPMFPGARFVHVMRDGRATVNSMINSRLPSGWASDFREACRMWASYTDRAARFGERLSERYLGARYDLLTQDPDRLFSQIFAFLGTDVSHASVEYVQTTRINSSYQPDGPMGRSYLGPSDPWLEWTPAQREIFVDVAGSSLVAHGFATEAELAVE
jgi:hypothetical protein